MKYSEIQQLVKADPKYRPLLVEYSKSVTVEADLRVLSIVTTAMICNDYCFRHQIETIEQLIPEVMGLLELARSSYDEFERGTIKDVVEDHEHPSFLRVEHSE